MLTRSKLKEMAKDAARSDLASSGKILKESPSKQSRNQREQIKKAASPPLVDTSKSKKRKQVEVVAQADQVSGLYIEDWSKPKQERVNNTVKSDQAKITRIMEGPPSKQSRKEREQTKKEKASLPLLNPSESEKGKQKWSEPKQEKVDTTVKSDQVEPLALELMQINDPIHVEPLAIEPEPEPEPQYSFCAALDAFELMRLVMARWRFYLQKRLDALAIKYPNGPPKHARKHLKGPQVEPLAVEPKPDTLDDAFQAIRSEMDGFRRAWQKISDARAI